VVTASGERLNEGVVVEAHISQADSSAVVSDPTAKLSAWETERGNDSPIASSHPCSALPCVAASSQWRPRDARLVIPYDRMERKPLLDARVQRKPLFLQPFPAL
jgi:hypothetical protein